MADAINGKNFFERIMDKLEEKPKRLVAGAAALSIGRGGISAVARMGNVSRPTIYLGIKEIKESGPNKEVTGKKRQRRSGGGRKSIDSVNPQLVKELNELIKPYEHAAVKNDRIFRADSLLNSLLI